MTFSFIKTREVLLGSVKVVYGTFTNDGDSTGGDIETNLRLIENFNMQYIGSAVIDAPVVNGALSVCGGKKMIELTPTQGIVKIVTVANTTGFWTAFGQ